jgi:hypothetical protein
MRLKEIEQFHQGHNVLPNQGSTLRRIQSINELNSTEEYFFRRIILLICVINSILGYYLLANSSFYIIPKESFFYRNLLKYFIIIYSLNLLLTLMISFIISLFIYIFYLIFIKKRSKNEISVDDVSLIPYTFTIFIILDIILYFLALPFTIFLFWKMIKNEIYADIKKFLMLYIFIGINFIIGLILLYIIFVMILKNATHSVKQIKFDFDELKLNKIKDEINDAMKNVNKKKKKSE